MYGHFIEYWKKKVFLEKGTQMIETSWGKHVANGFFSIFGRDLPCQHFIPSQWFQGEHFIEK
jgi:hypothetical protein